MTLKVGEILNLAVPFSGLPKPTVDWKFNGKEINGKCLINSAVNLYLSFALWSSSKHFTKFSDINRIKVKDLSTSTTLNIKEVTQKDTGTYKLTLSNSVASKSYDINVKVLSKELQLTTLYSFIIFL